jgi:hypothetical protein
MQNELIDIDGFADPDCDVVLLEDQRILATARSNARGEFRMIGVPADRGVHHYRARSGGITSAAFPVVIGGADADETDGADLSAPERAELSRLRAEQVGQYQENYNLLVEKVANSEYVNEHARQTILSRSGKSPDDLHADVAARIDEAMAMILS